MRTRELAHWTWEELAELDRSASVVILPVGATEAHGPHLPLATDVIIAQAMARRGAEKLAKRGVNALVAPPLAYTVAGYAEGFPGTLSIQPATATALVVDVARALAAHRFGCLALANAHLDPSHIGSLHAAVERIETEKILPVVYPDITKKPWALRLGDEFKSGACHAGQFEGSVVMAEHPELVRDELRRELEPNPVSLSRAIREGKHTFEEAGGARAYFGDPAAATPEEGRDTIEALGAIVEQAVREALGIA